MKFHSNHLSAILAIIALTLALPGSAFAYQPTPQFASIKKSRDRSVQSTYGSVNDEARVTKGAIGAFPQQIEAFGRWLFFTSVSLLLVYLIVNLRMIAILTRKGGRGIN